MSWLNKTTSLKVDVDLQKHIGQAMCKSTSTFRAVMYCLSKNQVAQQLIILQASVSFTLLLVGRPKTVKNARRLQRPQQLDPR